MQVIQDLVSLNSSIVIELKDYFVTSQSSKRVHVNYFQCVFKIFDSL